MDLRLKTGVLSDVVPSFQGVFEGIRLRGILFGLNHHPAFEPGLIENLEY